MVNSPYNHRLYIMQRNLLFKPFILIICLCWYSIPLGAAPLNHEQKADKIIAQLYHNLHNKPTSSMSERIELFSRAFLNKPYLLGALGEGADEGQFDQSPLYRADAFDCETFVDTVLALAFANNLPSFKQCIRNIRYRNGHVSFIERNHFASLDWNINNQRQGYTKDITRQITDIANRPVAKTATALINKPQWYNQLKEDAIQIDNISDIEKAARLNQLKQSARQLKAIEATTPYIPLSVLFDKVGLANQHIFKQIPNASIIEIVRPNWDLREQIGTCLNISHMGFAIWDKGTLMYREASSVHNRTIDVPLEDYLRNALDSPTIKGINVQIVLPEKPLPDDCKTDIVN